jgi:catalase
MTALKASLVIAAFAAAVVCPGARAQTAAPAPVAPPAAGPAPSTATQTIDLMNQIWGKHPFARANHAKGVVAEGSFAPSPAARRLSRASIFGGPVVPVTVRFSDSTGLPTLPDASDDANPHGMAVKFHTASGGYVDLVTNSLGFFPVATGEEFLALFQALASSPPGAPHPTPAEQFFAAHPAVLPAFASATTPVSLARESYNGVDAFVFVDAAGHRQPFRFKIVPVAGTKHLAPAVAAKLPPDVLVDELPRRLAHGHVAFRLMAQLAAPGDVTKDPTRPWPATRKLVDMGTITLTRAAADQVQAQKDLRYLPTQLEPGIEVSDDPLIEARSRAYVISFVRRAR